MLHTRISFLVTLSCVAYGFFINPTVHWPNGKNVTYSLFVSTIVNQSEIELFVNETNIAFDAWRVPKILQFFDVGRDNPEALIKIKFLRGDHDDFFPFDGPGGVLAHGFAPPNGEIHFDADEIWRTGDRFVQKNETNYLSVLLHEVGHALGLFHSHAENSVMNPNYSPSKINEIQPDDSHGIEQLYDNNEELLFNYTLPYWVYSNDTNGLESYCEYTQGKYFCLRTEGFLVFDQIYWRFNDCKFSEVVQSGNIKDIWNEVCDTTTGVSNGYDVYLLGTNKLWYEYNNYTMLNRVLKSSLNYDNMFMDRDDKIYGIKGAYVYTIDNTGDKLKEQNVGKVKDKLGLPRVEWVIPLDYNVLHVGVGRAVWKVYFMFESINLGPVYKLKDNVVQPIFSRC
ncbi:mp-nase [Adoxophyes orana granulovirus]|uniref:Metalloproteinase n=1 Tax=Adoxophyes orana granulovirus TaxID=170617 RepID=Q7T9X8_GVAO|nr:mp-nase [Adoxophyes orana granulovirus]AAP85674.1 mp-nase [Adoxophyes orana granulovirus]AJA91677.1 metalloproteinase [Adoxophyes orana granulovirus]